MDTRLATTKYRLNEWAKIIQNRNESGLKIDDYCREHGLSRNAYYYWLRKVKAYAISSAQESFVEVTDIQSAAIHSKTDLFKPQLTITVGNVTISVDSDTPTELIKRVYGVMNNA